jgi:hypothetical protein
MHSPQNKVVLVIDLLTMFQWKVKQKLSLLLQNLINQVRAKDLLDERLENVK